MLYGLIGENVAKSFSSKLHSLITDKYEYQLLSMNLEELKVFLNAKNFNGVNVTTPYKQVVIPYLDNVDESVSLTGACNIIVNRNGVLSGYNSDFYGFKALLDFNNIDLRNKKVAILGTGATSETVASVIKTFEGTVFTKVSCHSVVHSNSISKDEFYYQNFDVVINTTVLGKFDKGDESPIDLSQCKFLPSIVIDVNYNPLKSKLLVDAQNLNLKSINGLYMLVAQAIKTSEFFLECKYDSAKEADVYKKLLFSSMNIVIYGMPYNGKTTIGNELGKRLKKQVYDLDFLIEQKEKMSCSDIITSKGEEYFRLVETSTLESLKDITGSILVMGGGTLMNNKNVDLVRKNGLLVHIVRDDEEIRFDDTRPLTSCRDEYLEVKEKRKMQYNKIKDVEFYNDYLDKTIDEMEDYFNGFINY